MKKVFKILSLKYLLAIIAFVVVMLYFDPNNWFIQQDRKKELKQTIQSIEYLQKETDKLEADINALHNDSFFIEKTAREKYHYKRNSEDVFLIVNDTVSNQ